MRRYTFGKYRQLHSNVIYTFADALVSEKMPILLPLHFQSHSCFFAVAGPTAWSSLPNRDLNIWRYLSHCSKHLDNISIFLSDDISVIDFLNFRTAPFLWPSLSYSALQMVFLLLLLLSLLLFPQQQTRIFYGCRSEWFEWWPT